MRALLLLIGIAPLAFAAPGAAQTMDHSSMPGMNMPAKPAAKPPAPTTAKKSAAKPKPKPKATAPRPAKKQTPAAAKPAADPHAGHDMTGMNPMPAAPAAAAGDPHAGHDMTGASGMEGMQMPAGQGSQPKGHDMSAMPGMGQGQAMPGYGTGGTALPAGNAPAPAPPTDHYADRVYSPAEMARARDILHDEHGGAKLSMILFNLAEYQIRDGRDAYRWDGGAWYGGDINRLVLKTEGEGNFGRSLERAELQALYARAIGPFTDFQAGIRYDFKPNPSRVYATVGFESLAPGFFDVEGALFLSSKGDVLGRVEGYYDQRITQRLILQPRLEAEFAAQDVPEDRIGSGLSDLELGLRLRYEVKREFAPYVGVSYERRMGRSARFAREDGEDASSTSLVLGVRTWF